ncbi:putative uncharacterized protein DDB_G0282133 [Spodoptera litura]|uniref:Uncharacterized protein n=1 Tax=Spodoptera litura TaxID=69820 RepID=A0A9J7J0X3_SPOLT|nr:putative uncharacterized protein DDB_G0282133 [Spodoptera litura]
MKLAIYLLLTQIGYILAKSVYVPPCKNHSESLRIARSDEKTSITPLNFDRNSEDVFEKNSMLKSNDNNPEKLPNFNANYNQMQTRRYLFNNQPEHLAKWPTNLNKMENKNKANAVPVSYQAIDPKNIFVYGLYPTKVTKNRLTNNDTKPTNNTKYNKTITDYNELDKNEDKDTEIQKYNNQTNDSQFEFETTSRNADVANIRELRQHLLDHLLDYFVNIIIEEYNHNVTRKKNSKDVIEVENKLRNYYGPQTDVLEVDDANYDDHDFEYDNYRRKSDDETEADLNKDDHVVEKNNTDKELVETPKNDTEIKTLQLPQQPTNKDPVYIDDVSNTTIMIPIIEDYDDSLEIVASTIYKKRENNDTIIETTETSLNNLDNIATTTDKYDILQEIKPINVSDNVTDDDLYVNEEEDSTEKLVFEDFPDSDDYSSIENDTSASVTDKTTNDENITVSTNDGEADNDISARRILNDDLVLNSDGKQNKTKTSGSKLTPLISRQRELNEKIVIVSSPYSSEQELSINVNNKHIKSKKSRKSSKKQKKDGRISRPDNRNCGGCVAAENGGLVSFENKSPFRHRSGRGRRSLQRGTVKCASRVPSCL